MPVLTIAEDGFRLDGAPFQIISGAMHYFRVHPDQWADRIDKARLMGLNTIDTYVPWNAHQPEPGTFRLDGMLDLPRYLDMIAEAGLHVLLRPGPYICAEWEGGGLPAWLLANPGIRLRSTDPAFTKAVDDWFDLLLSKLSPYLASNGGPVLAVQVENEFGAYADDAEYLAYVANALRSRGVSEPLFTCDQAGDETMLTRGGLDGVLRTGTFGSRVGPALETLRRVQPTGPLMCTEFWNGWFDRWGGPHHTRSAEDAARDLDDLLAAGASVSFYMFHGGTNFGFGSGANLKHAYEPTITSYDYDAPLSEPGEVTAKYEAFREVIAKYAPVPDEPLPAPGPRFGRTGIALDTAAALLEAADTLAGVAAQAGDVPLTMEELGQNHGLVVYRSSLPKAGPGLLAFDGFADRAQVFVDGIPAGTLAREDHEHALPVHAARAGAELTVLVENTGRVNYGPGLADRKGLLGAVTLDGERLGGWTCVPLPMEDLSPLSFADAGPGTSVRGPVFRRGYVEVDEPADTFLALPGWTKGLAWVNGFHLGRYWSRGPQRTLYVPGPLLRPGRNEITVLELYAATSTTVDLLTEPDLGVVAD